ncbi:MAG TPA: DUF1844 domain-containing protein [Thermoanaerobaculia bacterium]|nr:DUF1844 domain-containing protein [Thermoanaerobaculia bacterium]
MSDEGMKVTDKRMFNADGELREEFRSLESGDEGEGPAERSETTPASEGRTGEVEEAAAERKTPLFQPAAAQPGGGDEEGEGSPSFYDLVALLAEPVAIYLGDAKLGEGESVENLELARLHIDLLKILKDKTSGNLSSDEAALLDDLVYRFQLRYVQKRG